MGAGLVVLRGGGGRHVSVLLEYEESHGMFSLKINSHTIGRHMSVVSSVTHIGDPEVILDALPGIGGPH